MDNNKSDVNYNTDNPNLILLSRVQGRVQFLQQYLQAWL